jgi:hypothetical protein
MHLLTSGYDKMIYGINNLYMERKNEVTVAILLLKIGKNEERNGKPLTSTKQNVSNVSLM